MTEPKSRVRVRFPPSPTGHWHLGGARTALFNWLFAKKNKGDFVLRIEDTDTERSRKEYEGEIMEALRWLGLRWDEGPDGKGEFGPYRQSERLPIYEKYLKKLIEDGRAYYCYCSKEDLEAERQSKMAEGLPPKYGGRCRALMGTKPEDGKKPEVIRFIVSEREVVFQDMIRGRVSFDAGLFGDVVIAKDLRSPLYNFAVTVDDFEMKISHVIRGEEHISNTPKQILLQEALGFQAPHYAHLPLILAQDRSKLSKRYMETSILKYQEEGYLPEALLNFLALLGWHPSGDKEIFTMDELIEAFDLKRVQKAGAVFNVEKLQWMNQQHIKLLSVKKLVEILTPQILAEYPETTKSQIERIIKVERDRLKLLGDFMNVSRFFFELPDYDRLLLAWKEMATNEIHETLEEVKSAILEIPDAIFDSEHLQKALAPIILRRGRGEVLWPLRVSLSGLKASPDPLTILEVLGKRESIRRIEEAIKKLS